MKHGQTNKPFATAPTDPTKRHAKKLPPSIALPAKAAKNHSSLISFGSVVALTGFILSGPVGFAFVQLVKPLPRWTSAADFAAHYNALQNIPYYFGFILVGGMLILSTAHYLQAENALPTDKLHVFLSVVWTTIFAALVFFNYICQTAYIHHLATHYKPENDAAISMFSMSNPASLSWAIEMWGYAFLGVATWLLAASYREQNKTIYVLLITNGVTSVGSAALYTYNGEWLLTTTGLAGYLVWNLLMIVLLLCIYRHAKKRADLHHRQQSGRTRITSPHNTYS